MAYSTLKAAIQAFIKQNGNNEITGPILQQALLSMINSLGDGYQFKGVATPATNPGTPDQNVFYIASEVGTYSNFGLSVGENEVAIFLWNGSWSKQSTGAASAEAVNQLGQEITELDEGIIAIARTTGMTGTGYGWLKQLDIPTNAVVRNLGQGAVNLYVTKDYSAEHTEIGAGATIKMPYATTWIRGASSTDLDYDLVIYWDEKSIIDNDGELLSAVINSIKPKVAKSYSLIQPGVSEHSNVPAYTSFTVGSIPRGAIIRNNSSIEILTAESYTGGSYVNRQDIPSGGSIIADSEKNLFKTLGDGGDVSLIYFYPLAENVIFGYNLVQKSVTSEKLADKAVKEEKIDDNSVSEDKVKGTIVASSNLYNKNDTDCVDGKYVNYNNGRLYSNPDYKTSGWIPVTPGEKYIAYKIYQCAFYDSNKEYISGVNNLSSTATAAPAGAAFIRCSIDLPSDDVAILNQSETLLPYEPYYKKKKNLNLITSCDSESVIDSNVFGKITSRLWNGFITKNVESLQNGGALALDNYPKSLKNGDSISFYAKVTDFTGGITIGKGFTAYGSLYFLITETQVIMKAYAGSESILNTANHGLTISDFIKVVISCDGTKVKLILQSLQGIFTEELSIGEFNGVVKVQSNGASLTDVVLSATNYLIQKPIWAFGDSYFGITSPAREMYYLKEWGYLNFLLQGYPGQASSAAFADMQLLLAIAKPKYIIWCLGMNDNTGLDAWKGYVDQIKTICSMYGIELILSTIPKPISSSYLYKDEISQWVRTLSGCRYIDVAKAVNSDENGHWYGYGESYDYQSSDNVHPTSYGAKAIASQFLIDVPEILQYSTPN